MYRAPRGTSDILPQEQHHWRFIEQKAAGICQLYGYERIDVPVFEDTGLFVRSIGDATDIVEKEMYTFEDRGGDRLTLKPEGTASVCRAYLQHGMHNWPQPVKLYYLSAIFRYERPQAGRFRQHHQFGCEAIGDGDPTLDAEIIDMAWQLLQSLGLGRLVLQLNSIGCQQCRPAYMARLRDFYAGHEPELCPDCRRRLRANTLRLFDCKNELCQQVADVAPRSIDHLCPDCDLHFQKVGGYLNLLGLPFAVNHHLVRGLDYYTKTVFEIQPEHCGTQSTICGGGRYDELIAELGGKPTPAIGFATGIERIILNLKEQAVPVLKIPRPRVFLAYIGGGTREETVKLAARLRRSGIGVVTAAGSKSLKAQLRQANNLDVPYTVIIGEQEIEAGAVILRDMSNAEQETVPLEQLQRRLQQLSV